MQNEENMSMKCTEVNELNNLQNSESITIFNSNKKKHLSLSQTFDRKRTKICKCSSPVMVEVHKIE